MKVFFISDGEIVSKLYPTDTMEELTIVREHLNAIHDVWFTSEPEARAHLKGDNSSCRKEPSEENHH